MRSLSVFQWMPAVVIGFGLLSGASAQAEVPNPVTFDTADGVKLQGYFYPGSNGAKSPTVLLLHNFTQKDGGSAMADGWGDLAKALMDKGYAVLAFDFRGHGRSTSINKEFWTIPHNQRYVKGFTPVIAKQPTTIACTSFQPAYYNYFINDIIAARAYLDAQNDAKELNTSQLIVIGAGEGATLGAMWMASEFHRKRAVPPKFPMVVPNLRAYTLMSGNFEGSDLACGIWLSMSPTLAGRDKPVTTWLLKAGGGENKVPMCFVYGSKDKNSPDRLAQNWLNKIVPNYVPKKENANADYKYHGEKAIDSALSGSKLLDNDLETKKFLIDSYIEPLMKWKGQQAWRARDYTNNAYLYVFPPNGLYAAKMESEMLPRSFPLSAMVPGLGD